LLFVLVHLQAVQAESVRSSVSRGNRLYAGGNFNEAINEYDEALLERPDALEPKFNKANSYYRLDDLAQAMDLYKEVAAESKDMKLVAKARYNLGNCHFQQGLKQQDSNLEKALEGLRSSIVHWRQVLEIEPENEMAAKNIEVARLIIKDMKDRLNKQKQQQEQQAAKRKQMQEKLKELLDRQKALGQQTRQTKNQADKGDISPEQATTDYAGQAAEQSQLRQQAEEISEQLRQQDANSAPPPQMQQAADELDKASANQTDAEDRLNASDGAKAKDSQGKAVEHIENALKTLSEGDQQGQQQPGQQQQQRDPNEGQDPNEAGQPKEQKAHAPDATAEEILDREQHQRRQRQMLQRGQYQKVEKDW
jgi:Ca-activated chloride channel family protein